jgi:hydroxysqualene synthase
MKFTKEELYELCQKDGGRFQVYNITGAYEFCKKVTVSHYENFPVASFLIPENERKYIYAVYAFARIADDIADELQNENKNDRIKALDQLSNNLIEIEKILLLKKNNKEIKKQSSSGLYDCGLNPILAALGATMLDKSIPIKPFQKLLIAFKKDIQFVQPISIQDVIDYCFYSANPVGELILRIFNIDNPQTIVLSDNICTGLQLVNFWQDLSIDIKNDRCYIPQKILKKYNLNKDNLHDTKNSRNLKNCMDELNELTEDFFHEGKPLINHLKPRKLQLEIIATMLGGLIMLHKIKKLQSNIIFNRPKLNIFDIMLIALKTILYKH